MREYEYCCYSPSGNDTALVKGIVESDKVKKKISDAILRQSTNIEQVGFLDNKNYRMIMAGNEFCGNASRCAIYEYLKGEDGEIFIEISGCKGMLHGGITKQKVYIELPVISLDKIEEIKEGYYKIDLDGIQHLVIDEEKSKKYLNEYANIKNAGIEVIKEYDITEKEANGVIFIQNENGIIKIHPVVWVKGTEVLLYETSCGSGSIAVSIAMSYVQNRNTNLALLQPSGKYIYTECKYSKKNFKVKISGTVEKDEHSKMVSIEED